MTAIAVYEYSPSHYVIGCDTLLANSSGGVLGYANKWQVWDSFSLRAALGITGPDALHQRMADKIQQIKNGGDAAGMFPALRAVMAEWAKEDPETGAAALVIVGGMGAYCLDKRGGLRKATDNAGLLALGAGEDHVYAAYRALLEMDGALTGEAVRTGLEDQKIIDPYLATFRKAHLGRTGTMRRAIEAAVRHTVFAGGAVIVKELEGF